MSSYDLSKPPCKDHDSRDSDAGLSSNSRMFKFHCSCNPSSIARVKRNNPQLNRSNMAPLARAHRNQYEYAKTPNDSSESLQVHSSIRSCLREQALIRSNGCCFAGLITLGRVYPQKREKRLVTSSAAPPKVPEVTKVFIFDYPRLPGLCSRASKRKTERTYNLLGCSADVVGHW